MKEMFGIQDNLESYCKDLQRLQIKLEDPNQSPFNQLIDNYVVKEQFYYQEQYLKNLEGDLARLLEQVTIKTGDRGKLMAKNAMEKYLDNSEQAVKRAKALRAINMLDDRQTARRLQLYESMIKKEISLFGSTIEEFKMNAKISGRTEKDVLAEMVKAATDKNGISQGFQKRIQRVAIDASRREAQDKAQAEYMKAAKPGEEWQWITVSSKPCPDCQARAGVVMPYERWQADGTPGAGRTVCSWACLCQLIPASIADEMFPEVKSFNWDSKNLVLTTAGEAREFKRNSL